MWSKALKKLVALHLIVAFLLVVLAFREKEADGKIKDYMTAAMVLLSIATAVTTLWLLKCVANAASGDPYRVKQM